MRIGAKDFELGHRGRMHQAIWDAIPAEGEAVDYGELKALYEQKGRDSQFSFDQVLENLEPRIESRKIGATTFYRRKHWLASAEVARILGVSERTVQAWHQKGLLPATRAAGGHLRFASEEVEAWASGEKPTAVQGADDSVLAELWDNDADAAYDRLQTR